jgi:hypothetical protein
MKRITVQGRPGWFHVGGPVEWKGKNVGKVISVDDSGVAVCEVDDDVCDEIMSCKIDTSMGYSVRRPGVDNFN